MKDEKTKKAKTKMIRKTAGRVTGPVQPMMGESVHPIRISTIGLTRCCATNEKDEAKERTMGAKYCIPYALYRIHVYLSPFCAQKTLFDQADQTVLENSFITLFEEDRSSMRGEMTVRGVFKFKHESAYGNVKPWKLFKRIDVSLKDGVKSPQSFDDYVINIIREDLPKQVELTEIEGEREIEKKTGIPIKNRCEYVILVDVKNGNPNGDPDADGRPRWDPISGKGLITGECIKRKVRNYVQQRFGDGTQGMDIFVQEGHLLNDLIEEPYEVDSEVKAAFEAKKNDPKIKVENIAQKFLCAKYYDIRTFGAVLSTGDEKEFGGETATVGIEPVEEE